MPEYQLALVTVGLDHMTPKEAPHRRSVVESIRERSSARPLWNVGIDAPSQSQEVLKPLTVAERSHSHVGRHPEGSSFLCCSTEPIDEEGNLLFVQLTIIDNLHHQLHVEGLMEVVEAPGMVLAGSIVLEQTNQSREGVVKSRSWHE